MSLPESILLGKNEDFLAHPPPLGNGKFSCQSIAASASPHGRWNARDAENVATYRAKRRRPTRDRDCLPRSERKALKEHHRQIVRTRTCPWRRRGEWEPRQIWAVGLQERLMRGGYGQRKYRLAPSCCAPPPPPALLALRSRKRASAREGQLHNAPAHSLC